MLSAVSTDLMRKSDLATIEGGVSGIELMYRAAMGVYNSVKWNGKIAIISGSGNNAGDGYALALILKENGFECDIVLISEDKFSPDGKYYFERCKKSEIRTLPREKCDFSSYDIIVDCIFGTGFKGVPREPERAVIEAINKSGAYVVSVDINSGLNGDSGMYECAVRSDITISIGTLKSGHFLGMAKNIIGKIVNCPIGIEIIDTPYGIFEDGDCKRAFKERKAFSNKGDYGYVALIGGCMEYSPSAKHPPFEKLSNSRGFFVLYWYHQRCHRCQPSHREGGHPCRARATGGRRRRPFIWSAPPAGSGSTCGCWPRRWVRPTSQ